MAASISAAQASTVGASNRIEIGKSTEKTFFTRAKSRTAIRLWPPRSKKLSRTPISLMPSSSCHIADQALLDVGARGQVVGVEVGPGEHRRPVARRWLGLRGGDGLALGPQGGQVERRHVDDRAPTGSQHAAEGTLAVLGHDALSEVVLEHPLGVGQLALAGGRAVELDLAGHRRPAQTGVEGAVDALDGEALDLDQHPTGPVGEGHVEGGEAALLGAAGPGGGQRHRLLGDGVVHPDGVVADGDPQLVARVAVDQVHGEPGAEVDDPRVEAPAIEVGDEGVGEAQPGHGATVAARHPLHHVPPGSEAEVLLLAGADLLPRRAGRGPGVEVDRQRGLDLVQQEVGLGAQTPAGVALRR